MSESNGMNDSSPDKQVEDQSFLIKAFNAEEQEQQSQKSSL